MPNDFLYDVFISYSSSDLAFAEQLHQRLVDAGFRVWFDKARLNPGCDWHKEIEAGCESSRMILPVLTPRWKDSKWTKFETYGADCVIPLVVEGNAHEVFTPPITRFQAQQIDLAVADESQWLRLIESIRTQLEKPEPDKLARLADVRYQSNPYFVGREAELLQIHEELHSNPTAVLTQGRVRAIAALGGVGKTTLAREYIEQFWRCYSQIFWVDCRKGVETELARICDVLLPQYRTDTDVPVKAKLAYRELLARQERLLIYDNGEDETSLQKWIPNSGRCRTLITSRFSAWSASIKTIHLGVLAREPACALLAARAGRGTIELLDGHEQEACKILADKLGRLPLALEQAAAYIEQQGAAFLFDDYIRLYDSATEELLAAGVLGSTEYPDSVVTTWKTTVAKLSPVAQAILRLCSFMAPTPIPIVWLSHSAEDVAATLGLKLPSELEKEVFIRQGIQQLRQYSMISGDGHTIQVHILVQTVERLHLVRESRFEQYIFAVLKMLDRETDKNDYNANEPSNDKMIGPHIVEATNRAECHVLRPDFCGKLLGHLGQMDYVAGRYDDAVIHMRRSLASAEKCYGSNHTNVATCMNILAQSLCESDQLIEAELLQRRALEIHEANFGSSSIEVARGLHNLGTLMTKSLRLLEAETLLLKAINVYENCKDFEKGELGLANNAIGCVYLQQKRFEMAERHLRRAISLLEESFGVDHRHVATNLVELTHLLSDLGQLSEAESLCRRAITIFETTLGPMHPSLATTLSNMSLLLSAQGRLLDAEAAAKRALTIHENALGSEHSAVGRDLSNLAAVLIKMHRFGEAEPLLQHSLAILTQSIGAQHPDLMTPMMQLSLLQCATNRFNEAEINMRCALQICEAHYGDEHPTVATLSESLGHLLQAANKPKEAESLMRRALAIDEQSYGPEHPKVAIRLNNLASLLKALKRLSEAEPLMRRALAIDEQSYGPEHPDVARDLNNLALLLGATNRLAEAEPLMRRALEIARYFGVSNGHELPTYELYETNYRSLLSAMDKSQSEIDQIISDLLK